MVSVLYNFDIHFGYVLYNGGPGGKYEWKV